MHIRIGIMLFIAGTVLSGNVVGTEKVINPYGMEFVWIPPGEFQMGTHPDALQEVLFEMEEPDIIQIQDEAPQHTVRISKGYWLGKTEVTQAQWNQVMKTKPGPSEHWSQKNWQQLPVVSTSWNMAQQFVARLSQLDPKYNYRLPTEAEWEYAARDGSNQLRPVKVDELNQYAWSLANSKDVPHPVATRKPNAFGLYDMLGNAWEWVQDRYSEYSPDTVSDPGGAKDDERRIRRGGSYHCPLYEMRPAFRSRDAGPDVKYTVTGFRVIAEEKTKK